MASAVLAEARVDTAAERVSDLHAEYGEAVFRYCRRHLRSREDAEDAAQVVFMNAYRSLAKGAVPVSDSAWLFKIAENAVLYRRRRIIARERVEVPVPTTTIDEFGPPRTAELYGAGREIVAALALIPLDQQRAIVLREWQGLSYRDVAETLGVSETTAAMLVIRARNTLTRVLDKPPVRSRKLGLEWLGWLLGPLDRIAVGSLVSKAATGLATVAAVALPVGTVVAKMPSARPVGVSPQRVVAHAAAHRHTGAAQRTSARAVSYSAPSPSSAAGGAHSHARSTPDADGVASAALPDAGVSDAPPLTPDVTPVDTPLSDAPADPPQGSGDAGGPADAAAASAPADEAPAPADDSSADQSRGQGNSAKPHPEHPAQARNLDSPSASAPGQTGVHPANSNKP